MLAALRRCWPFIWPYRRALGLGALLSLVAVAIGLAQPWPLRWIVDDVLDGGGDGAHPANATTILAVAVGALVGLVLVGAIVDYLASRLLQAAGLHIATALRVSVLDRLQRLSLRYHGRARVGDLVARVTSDVAYTQDMFVEVLATLLPSVLLVIGMFVVMLAVDPWFTLLALLATPPLVLVTHRSRLRLRQASRAVRRGRRRRGVVGDGEPVLDPADPGLHARGRSLPPVPGSRRGELGRRARRGADRVALRSAGRRLGRDLDRRRAVVRGPAGARR